MWKCDYQKVWLPRELQSYLSPLSRPWPHFTGQLAIVIISRRFFVVVYGRYKQVCWSLTKSASTKKVWLTDRQSDPYVSPCLQVAQKLLNWKSMLHVHLRSYIWNQWHRYWISACQISIWDWILLFVIPSQQRWRGYSNAAVRGWLGEWVGSWVSEWVGAWVRPTLPCGHDSDYSFCPITFKLHLHIYHDERRNPIDFGSRGQRSRSTLALCV